MPATFSRIKPLPLIKIPSPGEPRKTKFFKHLPSADVFHQSSKNVTFPKFGPIEIKYAAWALGTILSRLRRRVMLSFSLSNNAFNIRFTFRGNSAGEIKYALLALKAVHHRMKRIITLIFPNSYVSSFELKETIKLFKKTMKASLRGVYRPKRILVLHHFKLDAMPNKILPFILTSKMPQLKTLNLESGSFSFKGAL